ncbi:hypothetical protein BYT27DRAFT_6336716 [Phlegmacium glaucopus]|nr:hypothetical protein BYT27DRAFT_6336716 [Phlegmacium glaucopus]
MNVSPGAFHDSGERFDPPKCHPNTRLAVIRDILDWLDDLESPELVMWLHGAAGAGKSAIAQTIAQMLFEQGRLSGSFFFARGSTTGRDDEKRLVPTLSYQLAKYLPETRAHISMAVLNDPAIFDLSLLPQVENLLVNPLRIGSNAVPTSSNTSPRLFIIDGLDECRDADAQCRILRVFSAAMKSMQHHLPHKLLIASRSEIHLLAGFNEQNTAAVCRRLPLDNSYHPDHDIRLFLQDKFCKIKCEHHIRASLEKSWPSEETISSLVRKSSGQFIYASTVIKFVASTRHHPAERLKIILRLKTAGRNDRPFAALDSLYIHIFQNVEDIELVLCILRMTLARSFADVPHRKGNGELYRCLLGITVEELELALGDLISVISFDRAAGWFRFIHASVPDFLLDSFRSGTFYVDQPSVNLYRAKCCVKAICDIYSNRSCAASYLAAWFHLSDSIGRLMDPASRESLYQLLSSLDMRRAIDHHFSHLGMSPGRPFMHIAQVLLWSLKEYQTHPEKATSLLKLTHQFDIWLLSQLQSASINGFDNRLGIDLMVFAMTQIDGDDTFLEHRLNILGFLENGARTPSTNVVTALDFPSEPDRAELFFPWYIWDYAQPRQYAEYFKLLRCFLHDHRRSEKYFMSGARYANAALHCVKFVFDTRQSDTRDWDERQWTFERETLYLAMEYATFFLGKATATKPLFELLLEAATIPERNSGISSVISAIEITARFRLNSRIEMIFSIGQRTSGGDSLGALNPDPIFDRIFLSNDKTIAKWQEESVQMVVTAISEYVSTTCRCFFP